jgi:SHS2 domain-containing protein
VEKKRKVCAVMKSKTFEELAEEAVDDVLNRIEINGIPFRDFIEKLGNAYENKDCNLSSCRYNKCGNCIDNEARKECVTVSKAVLGI